MVVIRIPVLLGNVAKSYGCGWNSFFVSDWKSDNKKHHIAYVIDNADTPYYRDFLQLVIEGINKLDGIYEIVQDKNHISVFDKNLIEFLPIKKDGEDGFYILDYGTITEAKEQAIKYCFNNMEV